MNSINATVPLPPEQNKVVSKEQEARAAVIQEVTQEVSQDLQEGTEGHFSRGGGDIQL